MTEDDRRPPILDPPFDHNAECRSCDELAGHTADCPWLLERLEELRQLRKRLADKDEELLKANEKVEALRATAMGLERENHQLRTEKRQQYQLLKTIRVLADDATGTDRSQNDPRDPGALGAVKLLIERFKQEQEHPR